MKNSIQVHKEMIAELEANLKSTSEEFERMTALFDETKQQLEKKNVDVDNSRKWIHYLKDELALSFDKINDKSVKIAEYNYTIQEFEKILFKLYGDADKIKLQLEETCTNAEKLENKLKIERSKAEKAFTSSLKFDSYLSDESNTIVQNQKKLLNIVTSYKTSYQSKIDDLLKNIEKQSVVINDLLIKQSDTSKPLIEKFQGCINDVSEKWQSISTKLLNVFDDEMKSFSSQFVQTFLDDIKENEISKIRCIISEFEKELKESTGENMKLILSSFEQFIHEYNTQVQNFFSTTQTLVENLVNNCSIQIEKEKESCNLFEQYAKENIFASERDALINQVSQLIDSKLQDIQQNLIGKLDEISKQKHHDIHENKTLADQVLK